VISAIVIREATSVVTVAIREATEATVTIREATEATVEADPPKKEEIFSLMLCEELLTMEGCFKTRWVDMLPQ